MNRSGDEVIAALLAGVSGYMLGRAHQPARCGRIQFSSAAFAGGSTIKGIIMAFVLRDDQRVTVSITPVDARGNAAQLGSVPAWVDATGQTDLEPSADGLSCIVIPKGVLGTTQINVSADADLGDGVVTISGTLDLEIVAGQAVGFAINPGTPESLV